ncbi:DivIVA domain-containing protein [Corynebacterium alimapuense]|uniref:DivIVA domain-containing protein n=1 Tax=Corynebacterium alimapuense TaxID=1576874 RepID=A0A3M8K7I1_9CORY|nr:DivIVA domain-containing protein [Corynebacterium alimapuense]RNE48464.1 hypothetical protein C5L39_08130 [Corynebacterium alimapuense]
MLTWILLIVVLAAFVVLGTWFWGRVFGRAEVLPPIEDQQKLIENNRESIATGDLDSVRFEVVPRGYRPEQVDDVIAHLSWQIEQAHMRIESLSLPEKD